jgi:hypothetical protein
VRGDSLRISLLTASPGEEVYERFGHTALRVRTPQGEDLVFNYGLFSFGAPNFIYRFVKGETDYQLGATQLPYFTMEYAIRGSQVNEQELNLTAAEAQRIFDALLVNLRPENRVYRYNFFFDNCSTRPRDIVAANLEAPVVWGDTTSLATFRELVYSKTDPRSWLRFGIDLTLGAHADRRATFGEQMFLPEHLMQALDGATLADGRRLVAANTLLVESTDLDSTETADSLFDSPLFVCWALFVLVAIATFFEWRKRSIFRPLDTVIFLAAGLAGCILFFLNFISVHPCVDDNFNCIWLQPLHLFAAVAVWIKSLKKVLQYYHFVNFVALIMLLLFYGLIPQHFNAAFFPLIGILAMRSLLHVTFTIKHK